MTFRAPEAEATVEPSSRQFLLSVHVSHVLLTSLALFFLMVVPAWAEAGSGLLAQSEIASLDSVRATDLPASRAAAPLVYVDCNRCDHTFLRREITFVNHVRDPNIAHVHVLITDQQTGGGGRTFTLSFTGRENFAGIANTLSYTSQNTDTWPEQRQGLTEMLKLGLVAYVAQTPLAPQLGLTFHEPAEGAVSVIQSDPWNSWTFEVYGGGNLNTEASQNSWNARYGFFADRVTEDWKFRMRPFFNHNVRNFKREDDWIQSIEYRHGFDTYIIKSVGEHWGVGIFGDYLTTTFENIRHSFSLTPAVEFNFFPYGEASRRQFTITYRTGTSAVDYFEETIYETMDETLFNQSLNAAVIIRQPWGTFSSSVTGSHYFHDVNLYRVRLAGNLSLRIVRGVSLSVGGNYQRINDQIGLPRGDASLEDILLQRRRLATNYRASGQVGLSYTFGSIYSNVVNPRL